MSILREYFSRWGIAVNLTTDGASIFVSQKIESFLKRYGVTHRVSSSYYPRGNKRAEVAVKSSKRLILDNISSDGSLNTDRVARALLIHHNQTDPLTGLSPAEIIFGRRLRDHMPLQPQKFQPRAEWRLEADLREKAFAKRHLLKHEQLSAGSKSLPPLSVGDNVAVQDESKNGKPGKWTKTGVITDTLPFNSYEVKIHGSNLLTKRNRVHLRNITPFASKIMLEDQRSNSPPALGYEPESPPCPRKETYSPQSSQPSDPAPKPPSSLSAPPPTHPPSSVKPDVPKPKKKMKERWVLKNDRIPAQAQLKTRLVRKEGQWSIDAPSP